MPANAMMNESGVAIGRRRTSARINTISTPAPASAELGRDREPVDVGGRDLGSDAEDHFEPALWAGGIPFAFTPLSATPGSL